MYSAEVVADLVTASDDEVALTSNNIIPNILFYYIYISLVR